MSINVKGVDLSTFNTQVDFIKAKKSGIRFAILRAGFGSLVTQVDKRFRSHINGALEAKMDVEGLIARAMEQIEKVTVRYEG